MQSIELTIIVPVYNEEESLIKFKEEMDKYLYVSEISSGVLFVNDGSSDSSLEIIQQISRDDPRYEYISLARNSGLSTALKAGIDHSFTPFTGYIDADLQTTPMDFNRYAPFIGEYSMVNGIRAERHDSIVKKLSSKIGNGFRRVMIKDGIRDTCCPLKIMDTIHAKRMPFFNGMHRFIPALIQLQGGKVKQLEVQHFDRYAGTAKYHLWNRIVGPFLDTLAFRWMRSRAIHYEIGLSSIDLKTKPEHSQKARVD